LSTVQTLSYRTPTHQHTNTTYWHESITRYHQWLQYAKTCQNRT